MRALSIQQPWASLIACGRKRFEIRSWTTDYRGPLLVCAGRSWHKLGVELHGARGERGVAICVVTLADVRPMRPQDRVGAGLPPDYPIDGLYSWVLEEPRKVEAVPVKGRLGLFTPPPTVVVRLAGA